MCSISHDFEAIYIHIPKNGGSYVSNILNSYYFFEYIYHFERPDHEEFDGAKKGDHTYLNKNFVNRRRKGMLEYYKTSDEFNELIGMDNEKWKNYKKFTFIRNPYDKIVSAFHFINKIKLKSNKKEYKTLLSLLKNKENCSNYEYSHAFMLQYQDLLDENNNLNIDYLGDFNNLNNDFVSILQKIGIQKILHSKLIENNIKHNASNSLKNYIDYYNEETLQLVNEYFKIDFEKFNFKMYSNMDEFKKEFEKYEIKKEEFEKKNVNLLSYLKESELIFLDNIDSEINDVTIESKEFNKKNRTEIIELIKIMKRLKLE